jgi:hypothetical protein
VSLETLQGQLFLKLQLATSSRLARVTSDELEALQKAGANVQMP